MKAMRYCHKIELILQSRPILESACRGPVSCGKNKPTTVPSLLPRAMIDETNLLNLELASKSSREPYR